MVKENNAISKQMARVRQRLYDSPGRSLCNSVELCSVLQTLFLPESVQLIRAAVPYRQSPLRALVPLIDGQVQSLVNRLVASNVWDELKARTCVHRALSELLRYVCAELGMVPSSKTTNIGHPTYRRGAVYIFEQENEEIPW